MSEIALGELVVCAAREVRDRHRLGLDVGLYLIDRRRDGLVFFARPDRSEWLAKTALKAMAPDDPRVIAPPAWVVRVHRAAGLLDPLELELERDDSGIEVRIACKGLERRLWNDLHAILGADAADLQVRPGSMSRIRLVWKVDSASS